MNDTPHVAEDDLITRQQIARGRQQRNWRGAIEGHAETCG